MIFSSSPVNDLVPSTVLYIDSLLYHSVQYVFKVPQGEAEVMLSLMQEDARSALSSVGGKNFAIGFYIMKVSIVDAYTLCVLGF